MVPQLLLDREPLAAIFRGALLRAALLAVPIAIPIAAVELARGELPRRAWEWCALALGLGLPVGAARWIRASGASPLAIGFVASASAALGLAAAFAEIAYLEGGATLVDRLSALEARPQPPGLALVVVAAVLIGGHEATRPGTWARTLVPPGLASIVVVLVATATDPVVTWTALCLTPVSFLLAGLFGLAWETFGLAAASLERRLFEESPVEARDAPPR